jgi:hypothetical protein
MHPLSQLSYAPCVGRGPAFGDAGGRKRTGNRFPPALTGDAGGNPSFLTGNAVSKAFKLLPLAALLGTLFYAPCRADTQRATTQGKPASASSYAAGHVPADFAKANTGWVASTTSFPQWLVVDLGAIYDVTNVEQRFAASDVWSYKIEGSNDNDDNDAYWTTLADATGGVKGKIFTNAVRGSFRYVRLYVTGSKTNPASSVTFKVTGTLTPQSSASVPTPRPAATGNTLVGAQSCNLWANQVDWQSIAGYPARTSIMGTYNEAFDVATDWQIKMAVEHGISFMQGCWFRLAANEGSPTVMASYDGFLNSLANSAKYRNMLKFAITWVNEGPDVGTTSGVSDFVNNLVPYWINTYFKKSNYLKIGGKPVVAIYDFEQFITQMGSLANAQSAIQSFRAAVANAGYPGLILETQQSGSTTPAGKWVLPNNPAGVSAVFGNEYTGDYAHTNADAAAAGFDDVFAYHVPTFTDLMVTADPDDAQVSAEQVQAWGNWLQYSALPTIVSASMGWNAQPWGENSDSWQLTPTDYQSLLVAAQSAMAARGKGIPGSMIMLDNWNEYGEGHYISPTQGTGYGYLDAVGAVFSPGWPTTVPASVDTTPDVSAIPQMLN